MTSTRSSRMLRIIGALVVLSLMLATPLFAAPKKYSIVYIPKLIGIPWFNTMEKGLKEFATKTGDMDISVAGAPDTDPAAQARILEDTIAKKPDCIIVVPNDTNVVEPLMKKGLDAGILMLTQEAPGIKNAVADIEFLILSKEAKDMFDLFVKTAGTKGGYAIMVGGLTVEGHNQRADAIVKYQEKNFPNLFQVTSRLEGSENLQQSHDRTLELIDAYPNLVGVLYIGSMGGIGGAQAVVERNMQGKIAIVGTCIPSQAKKYLAEGSLSASYMGNPYRIGKDTAFIAEQLLKGSKLASISKLPEYGVPAVAGRIITFHADSEVTLENADSFGYRTRNFRVRCLREPGMSDRIALRNVSKHYPGIQALKRINFSLRVGESHCLVGENGSGKSTLIKIMSGVIRPDPGAEIFLDGNSFEHLSTRDAIDHGVRVIYQDLALFPNLSVKENIAFQVSSEGRSPLVGWRAITDIAVKAMETIGLSIDPDRIIGTLSIAEQQLVEIAKSLIGNLRILILDEPTASLTRKEVNTLFAALRRLKKRGVTTLFVSHKLNEVFEIAERVTVLRDGEKIGEFVPSELDYKKLVFLMTGKSFENIRPDAIAASAPNLLETRALSKRGDFSDVSFVLRRGEILGITGLLGSGRTGLSPFPLRNERRRFWRHSSRRQESQNKDEC